MPVVWNESQVKRDRLGRFSRFESGSIPKTNFLPDNLIDHILPNMFPNDLTSDEIEALDNYKVADFQGINNGLRGKEDLLPEEQEQIDVMDGVFARHATPEDLWVSRAVAPDAFGGKEPDELVGSAFQDDGFMSTTVSENLPGEFDQFADLYPVIMRLKVPKGTPAYYTEGLGDTPENEHELLLGRGREFDVTAVRELEGGRWEVFGELRKPEP